MSGLWCALPVFVVDVYSNNEPGMGADRVMHYFGDGICNKIIVFCRGARRLKYKNSPRRQKRHVKENYPPQFCLRFVFIAMIMRLVVLLQSLLGFFCLDYSTTGSRDGCSSST
ncbi:hypothetical protein ACV22V_16845 [Burkholderia sp. AW33-5]